MPTYRQMIKQRLADKVTREGFSSRLHGASQEDIDNEQLSQHAAQEEMRLLRLTLSRARSEAVKSMQEIVTEYGQFFETVEAMFAERLDAIARLLDEYDCIPYNDLPTGPLVYVVRDASFSGLFKIGYTTDIKRRLLEITGSMSVNLQTIHYVPVGNVEYCKALEKLLHNQFADKRKQLEWFTLTRDDIEWIQGIKTWADAENLFYAA